MQVLTLVLHKNFEEYPGCCVDQMLCYTGVHLSLWNDLHIAGQAPKSKKQVNIQSYGKLL